MFTRLLISAALLASLAACGNSTPTGADGSESHGTVLTQIPSEGESPVTTGDLSAYCRIEAKLDALIAGLAELNPSDSSSMRNFFEGMTGLLSQSVAVAPVEVKADLEQGLNFFIELKVELDKVNYHFSKITPEVAQRFSEIGQFFQNSQLADLSAKCAATGSSSRAGSSAG